MIGDRIMTTVPLWFSSTPVNITWYEVANGYRLRYAYYDYNDIWWAIHYQSLSAWWDKKEDGLTYQVFRARIIAFIKRYDVDTWRKTMYDYACAERRLDVTMCRYCQRSRVYPRCDCTMEHNIKALWALPFPKRFILNLIMLRDNYYWVIRTVPDCNIMGVWFERKRAAVAKFLS
jgi:hypothetical protein